MHAAWPPDHIPPQPDPGERCGALQLQGRGRKGPEVSAHVRPKLRKHLLFVNQLQLLFFCQSNTSIPEKENGENPMRLVSYLVTSHNEISSSFSMSVDNVISACEQSQGRRGEESCCCQLYCVITDSLSIIKVKWEATLVLSHSGGTLAVFFRFVSILFC